MRRAPLKLTTLALALQLAACSASNPSRPPGDANIIRRDEVIAGSYQTAYDVVRAIHPNWLVKRSPGNSSTPTSIWVYVDGSKYGDVSWLRNVLGSSVGSIQRIDAGAATTRWGTGHSEGVLYVTTYVRN